MTSMRCSSGSTCPRCAPLAWTPSTSPSTPCARTASARSRCATAARRPSRQSGQRGGGVRGREGERGGHGRVNDDELVDLARAFASRIPSRCGISNICRSRESRGERLRMFPAEAIRAALEEQLELEEIAWRRPRASIASGRRTAARSAGASDHLQHDRAVLRHCNRTRLTADGHFRWCLLDEGEIDLRGPMRAGRADEELSRLIEDGLPPRSRGTRRRRSWSRCTRARAFRRSMIRIGG